MSHRFTVSLHRVGRDGSTGDGRGDHLDWFFAIAHDPDSPLVTWSTPISWPLSGTDPSLRLPPHRARYLDFDGEISGGRGRVQRLFTGRYQLVENDPEQLLFIVESVAVMDRSSAAREDAEVLAVRLYERLTASPMLLQKITMKECHR